ncbi:MAG: ATP-binding protein [Pseudonocardiaceae bacterium]
MTSQPAGQANGHGPGSTTSSLFLESYQQSGTLVVRPVGELSPQTYERLRDGLFRYAAEEPAAIVVDLASMQTATASLLTVFPMVRDRIRDWPGLPVVLAAPRQPLDALLDANAVSRSVPTYRSVHEALQELDAAPPRRRLQVQLRCDLASSRLARQLIRRICEEWGVPGISSDAAVVASELIDNMVHHARSEGQLRVDLNRNTLTVSVADTDPRSPQLRVPGLRAAGGRGLVLVDKLSRTWGTASRPSGGKVVWAVLTVSARSRNHVNSAARA